MVEFFRRIIWVAIVTGVIALTIYIVIGNALYVDLSFGPDPIAVRDVVSRGNHLLSGMIPVANTCSDITVSLATSTETVYTLAFESVQTRIDACEATPVPRAFKIDIAAPSTGITFIATLDNKALPIRVYTSLAH